MPETGNRNRNAAVLLAADRAFNLQFGAVTLRDVFDDEAEAGAAGFTRAGAIDTVEAFGQTRDVLAAMPTPLSFTSTTIFSVRGPRH